MFNTFTKAFLYELRSIRDSWYKLFLITVIPLVSFVLIIAIFREGVLKELPVVVVDQDRSSLSRMVLHNIEASPTVKISAMPLSVKEAMDQIKETKAYALIVIPPHFEKDTLLQKNPNITAMINTQYILVGKILTSALSTTIMSSSAQVEYVKNLVERQNSDAAINAISPIGLQITPFFNMYQNYFYFLVSALLPAMWQIFIVITTLVAVGTIFKAHKESDFFKDTNHTGSKLIGLMFPYTLAFTFMGILFTLYLYSMWLFQGSFTVLFMGIFLTVVAYQFIAYLLFATGFDYARSLSLGAVYTAPAFAFLGITFPIYNMNGFALFWRDLLPISHYTQLQLSQANYGANVWWETEKLWTLLAFWIVFIPVIFLFKKKLKKVLK